MTVTRYLTLLLALLALATLPGCTDKLIRPNSQTQEIRDIHERLSRAIRKHGFNHGIRSQRSGKQDIDSIYIPIPLDSIKRHHKGFENLLGEIIRICAASDYVILIELATQDEADVRYMRSLMEPPLAGKQNITIEAVPDPRSDITITVMHPSQINKK